MNIRNFFQPRMVAQSILAAAFSIGVMSGQTVVTLPDSSQSTTMTASVSEQADVSVPATISFPVTDIASSTSASAASVSASNIALDSATKQLKISVQADAAAFTPPVGGATTWAAADVTWNAATWTSATGASGTMSAGAFGEVATCTADTASCSTSGLVFTLAPNTSVKRSGDHTLSVTWKFESIGT